MKALNYGKLAALKPTIYETFTNNIGQKFDLVEHPILGDEYPVIIMSHEHKEAFASEFFDTEDLTNENAGDYHPVYMFGQVHLGYEVGLEYPI